MNWKNFKIGAKLGVGFGILILIAVLLGGMAVVNMINIRTQTNYLANEYLPEMQISNDLEITFLEAIFELRAFDYSEEREFYQKGKQKLSDTDKHIQKAYSLANRAVKLEKLEGAVKEIDEGLQKYEQLVDQTADVTNELKKDRNKMDEAAAQYMQNCMNYLGNQNDAMSREISGGGTTMDRLEKITLINNIIDAGNAVRVANFKAQSNRNPAALGQAIDEFEKSFSYFTEIRKLTKLQVDIEYLDNIEKAGNGYKQAMQNFLTHWDKREKLAEERKPAYTAVINNAQEAVHAAVQGTNNIAASAVSLLNTSNNVMIIGLIFALIIGVIFAIIITRSITAGINKGVGYAQSVAQGDLTINVDKEYLSRKDEIGALSKALQGMLVKLRNIVNDVISGSDNIASASQEMSSSSQEMSQGANEQASSAEEVSSSMEEMASNIQQNTDNAKQTEKISLKAAEDISEGNKSVNITVNSMKNIAEKIKIIGEISRQTNILALNAAVEAARAGEHGKGFAVVAAEVRKLAERSQLAANEIDEVSKSSVDVAEKSGKLLESIVPDIEKTSKLVQEISAASVEQSSGAEQVNNAIQQLNQVTQQNAASSEEMATSSEELSSQAEQLKDIISFFVVDNKEKRFQSKGTGPKKEKKVEVAHMDKNKKQTHQGSSNYKAYTGNTQNTGNKGVNLDMSKGGDDKDNEFETF